jgi:hypothetical protein
MWSWWSGGGVQVTLSKSSLRDSLTRLRSIRARCGMQDEDGNLVQSTGDPFRDKVLAFMAHGKEAKELITERNDNARKKSGSAADVARDSHQVNLALSNLKQELKVLKDLVDDSDRALAVANKKKKKAEKIAVLEKQLKDRQSAYTNCVTFSDALAELNEQRHMTEKEVAAAAGQSKDQRANRPTGRQTLQQRLAMQKRKKAGGGEGADGGEEESGGGGKLSEDPATKEQARLLAEKQKKQDQSLSILLVTMGRIEDVAKQIGEEFDKQQQILKGTEDKMDKANADLTGLNKNLTKLMKEKSPFAMMLYVAGLLMILAVVGVILFQMNVI